MLIGKKAGRRVVLAAAACAGLLAASKASAADVSFSLERKIQSAPFWNAAISSQAASASVVTREDMAAVNVRQTTDILNLLPGLFITKTGDFGRADVNIRGLGDSGRDVGIYIDGRPYKMSLFGCAVTHTLPFDNVERVEVLRGPQSVLYGSDAFGGVVNIITRKAVKSFEGNALASYGSDNTRNTRFGAGGISGRLDYYVTADQRSSDGYLPRSRYDAQDYSSHLGYVVNDESEIIFNTKYFKGKKHEPLPASTKWNDYERGAADLTYNLNAGIFRNSLKVYRDYGDHVFSDGFHSRDHTDGMMLQSRAAVSRNNTLGFGADARYQFAYLVNVAPASMENEYHKYEYGLHVRDEQRLFDKLTLSAGARYNYDQLSGEAWTPQAGALLDVRDGTALRAGWSKGFRAPQLNDLYLWGGNKDLKPERVTSREAGIRQRLADKVNLDVSYFLMDGRDIIQAVNFKKRNIGSFTFRGVESMLTAGLTEELSGQLNYTWFDPGGNTQGRPKDKAGAVLKYAHGRLDASLTATYVGRYYAANGSSQRLSNYGLLDAKAGYKVSERFSVFAAADNITGTVYHVYEGNNGAVFRMPGRTYTCGVSCAF